MKPATLRFLLVLLLVIVQAITVVMVMLGMRDRTADHMTDSARMSLNRLANAVTLEAQRFIRPAENSVGLAAQLIQSSLIDARSDQALEQFFLAQLRVKTKLNGMYLARADGSYVSVSRADDNLLARQFRPAADGAKTLVQTRLYGAKREVIESQAVSPGQFDPRDRPWYTSARVNDSLVWSGVYRFASTKMPGITAALALSNPDGSDAGVIGVDIDIAELSVLIAQLPVVAQGSAVILDAEQNVIASSDPTTLSTHRNGTRIPTLEELADQALVTWARSHPVALATSARGVVQTYVVDGQEHLGLKRSLSLSQGRVQWQLLGQAPKSGFSGGLPALFNEKLWTIGLIILLPSLLAVAAVFGLTRPVFRLHQMATIDRLTGAYTRGEFEQRLQGMMKGRREREGGDQLVVVAFDLDGFKSINDHYGHLAGDLVLAQFVQRLRRRGRASDLIGRSGGDEFLLAIRLPYGANALVLVNRIRTHVVESPFETAFGRHSIGATAGVACYHGSESLAALLARADQALITGKARKKNRCYMAAGNDQLGPETVVRIDELAQI